MKSIDKLRRYFNGRAKSLPYDIKAAVIAVMVDDVFAMLDEIEREVKELTDERDLLKTQWEAGVDFDQRLEACAESREDVTLWGVDYMPYPLDADGVPIHVGDVMEWSDGGMFEVVGIGDTGTLYYLETRDDGTVGIEWTSTECKRHHAPTVEDVLEEFVARWMETHHDDIPALKAEYAARLRLAGDE